MYQGGMFRCTTCCLMAFAQGRVSSYASIENGPIWPGRWQFWHERSRIGATSLVNVISFWAAPACQAPHTARANTRLALVIRDLLLQDKLVPSGTFAAGRNRDRGEVCIDCTVGGIWCASQARQTTGKASLSMGEPGLGPPSPGGGGDMPPPRNTILASSPVKRQDTARRRFIKGTPAAP